MKHSVLIGAPDQTTGYEIRSLVEELDDFTVIDVADSSARLEILIAQRDPELVLLHASLGPTPSLQQIRDIVARRPGIAVILLSDDLTPATFTAAMDAGARGALAYPTSLEDLQGRLIAAGGWVSHMRKHLNQESIGADAPLRGQLIVVAGAKGGVGTTTITAHLAHDAVTRVPGRSVCLVDLDIEKGDIAHLLGIEHRLDISDLAKVADDLSAQTVTSAVHRDPSGLSTLLSPARLEDVGSLSDRETVLILAALRRHFDLVIADVGAHVTPVTAAAVETATQVLLVTTPDVLALRGVHRSIDAWKRFGSRKIEDVKIMLNKVHRDNDIQPDTAARLTPAPPIELALPDASKALERGLSHQSPDEVLSKVWWQHIHQLAQVVQTVDSDSRVVAADAPRPSLFARRKRVAAAEETGQATLEFAGMFPLIILIVLLIWQLSLWGVSAAFAGHAADESARAAGLGRTSAQVEAAGLDSVPSWFRESLTITKGTNDVSVRTELPILAPGFTLKNVGFTSHVGIVSE